MRRLLLLTALGLAGCVSQQPRPATVDDPLFGSGGVIPERAMSNQTENDLFRPRVPAPPPTGTRAASPAALATGGITGAGVTLGSPRPAAAPAPVKVQAPSTSAIQPVGGPGPATYEQVQARLKARGVDWQSLTQRGGESWHFHCAIPDPKNPGMRQNFETTRPCATPVAAMEAVLREIEGAPQAR